MVKEGQVKEEGFLSVIRDSSIVNLFHQLYYGSSEYTWCDTKWRGMKLAKCPLDLWQYQEIIFEMKPDVIIETGTWYGGSALFLRDMMSMIHGGIWGTVFTIDVKPCVELAVPGITQLIGDSVSPVIVDQVKEYITESSKVMVILDSDHSRKHVLRELDTWGKLVSNEQYLIVEDTNVNGHPVALEYGRGPWEALEEWLPMHPEFQHDWYRERFMMTFNPNGYYKKINVNREGEKKA